MMIAQTEMLTSGTHSGKVFVTLTQGPSLPRSGMAFRPHQDFVVAAMDSAGVIRFEDPIVLVGTGDAAADPNLEARIRLAIQGTLMDGQPRTVTGGAAVPESAPAAEGDAAKARAWDNLHNEGGEGYNPHRP